MGNRIPATQKTNEEVLVWNLKDGTYGRVYIDVNEFARIVFVGRNVV